MNADANPLRAAAGSEVTGLPSLTNVDRRRREPGGSARRKPQRRPTQPAPDEPQGSSPGGDGGDGESHEVDYLA